MKYWKSAWPWLVALLFGLAAAVPHATTVSDRRDFFFFEVELTSTRAGVTQVFFDVGRGENESDSSQQPLQIEPKPVVYRYMLPMGVLRSLRLDPIDREGTMTLANARIVDRYRRVVRAFDLSDFKSDQDVKTATISGGRLELETTPNARDPMMHLAMGGPLELKVGLPQIARAVLPVFVGSFAASLVVLLLAMEFASPALVRAAQVARARPILSIAAISVVAVGIQCHPVIFLGKSFVSPDNAAYMLYDTFPTLPGYHTTGLEEAKNSDVGAMLYQHLYYPRLEREALAHGELPFWNRYNLGGVTMLGQGQSMFGEILNFVPLAAGSAAWAWDFKFVVARFLYAFGLGLVVWSLARNLGSAIFTSAVGVFIGFFTYRMNHPSGFSLCFAPWIVFGWLLIRDAVSRRDWLAATGCLFLANWEVMTSGTVKEAYMAIACMNFAGLCLMVFSAADRPKLRLTVAAATGAGFILVATPLWLPFFDALRTSATSYDAPGVLQLPLSEIISLFDDLFFRQITGNEIHGTPSTNLLILIGVSALVACRGGRYRKIAVALAIACALPFAIAFKVIPGSWIMSTPFLANIHHVNNTFGTSLIILLTLVGGIGFAAAWDRLGEGGYFRLLPGVILIVGGVVALFFLAVRPSVLSPFFRGYLVSLTLAVAIIAIAGLHWHRHRNRGFIVAAVLAGTVIVAWRHGQFVETAFDTYVFNPKVRADLRPSSPAVDRLRSLLTEPYRTVGTGYTLFTGYNQMLGIEGAFGVDALRNRYYDDLAIAAGANKVRWWSTGDYNTEDLAALAPYYDLLGVRYRLAAVPPVPRDFPGLARIDTLDLEMYEAKTAWPRAFFTDRIATYASAEELVGMLRKGDRLPFAAIQQGDPVPANVPVSTGSVEPRRRVLPAQGYRLTPNSTSFSVEAPGPGVVVLTEGFFKDSFELLVNAEPRQYFRTNHAFRGFYVDRAGRYEVSYSYRPLHFTLALWMGLIGFIFLALLGLALPRITR